MNSDKQVTSDSEESGSHDTETSRLMDGIEQTRADLSATIDELETRLSPAEVREKVGVEIDQVEERIRVIVSEKLVEAQALLRGEMNEVEEKVKQGLGEAKDTIKQELQEAFTGAKQAIRANSLGKAENLATHLGDTMNDTRDTLIDTIRHNPLPAAVAGVGLAWLLMNRSKSARSRHEGASSGASQGRHQGGSDSRRLTGGNNVRANVSERSQEDLSDKAGAMMGRVGTAVSHAGESVSHAAQNASGAMEKGRHQVVEAASDAWAGASDSAVHMAHKAGDTASHLAHKAGDAASSALGAARRGAKSVEQTFTHTLQENPLALGGAVLAAGALLGYALPRTSRENALMGETRDDMLHRAGDSVRDAAASVAELAEQSLERAKHAVNDGKDTSATASAE